MILNFSVEPEKVAGYTTWNVQFSEIEYPIIALDHQSYIVSSSIQSGINFDIESNLHNIQIGKYTSIAHGTKFNVNLNHDYQNVAMGEITELKHIKTQRLRRKGEILIGNDVWIGSDVSIMGGVTIHNGAVVAANSVVTKDVPPYAIIGGNPAKIIKYRCPDDSIEKLNRIAWWKWTPETIYNRSSSFELSLEEFADTFALEEQLLDDSFVANY